MRFFGAVRNLSLLLLCASGVGCEDAGDPTGDGGSWSMDTGAVIGAPGPEAGLAGDAGTQGSDAGGAALDGGAPGLDGSAQNADATTTPGTDGSAAGPDAGPLQDASAPDGSAQNVDATTPAPEGGLPGTLPIPAPVADNCITNVSAGDHTFTCGDGGVSFQVVVDERCTKFACGLIFDVHGAAMSGQDMRNNTRLNELAPSKGYLVVHPSAPDLTWDWQTHPAILKDFMSRMISAFHVDTKRVHMTGFSMGAGMTFWFLCNHREVLASTAPVTGSSAQQVTVVSSGAPCIESIDANWRPRVPILFMSGSTDTALTIDAARARTEGIVMRLGLTGGNQIEGDASFTRKRWQGADGMVFDFLEHNYSNWLLAGHCIPGGRSGDLFGCDTGGSSLNWGQVVLQWFIEHPKP
jgi:poly(3-hydroxybutyrate) depolymerase